MAPVLRHCPCLRPESDDVKVLEYSHNNLEDVPNDVFSYERTLEELYLDANQIKDLPRALFHCHGLKKLNLSDNEIHVLPPAIASLINLEQLDISKNGVTEIPDNIKGCKCLSLVDASVNPLEKLPEGFTQLINLQELYLNDTFLEYLPANFGRLSKLRILELRENHLKVLPKSMARLTELSRLDIGQNDFSDLPEVIGSLPRLVELWCDCNNISCLPPFLGGLKKLSYLDASKNRIYNIAEEIEGCASLSDLTLSCNRIKELPEGLVNLRKMTVFRIDANRLTCLPLSIGNLVCMEEMVLSSNDLSRLPFTMGLLRNLKTLIADDNLLEELPCEMGSCQKLSILSLRDNKLVFIPDELGHIATLKVVNLSKNLLQCLPFSIAKLPNLQALWLSENQNKPLIPLQSDIDRMTGQKVLTCFMLPQVPLDEDIPHHPHESDAKEAERAINESKGRQLIKFAFDLEKDRPSKLVRAPTPYPKELKAHARHAKNYALKKQGEKEINGPEMRHIQQGAGAINMKEVPPDIMVMPRGAKHDHQVKVKEAVITIRKSPPPSPNSNRNANNDPKVNPQSSIESSGSDVPTKTLGRRDSRGDGSSSENASSSPVGSPKNAPSAHGQNHLGVAGYQKAMGHSAGKKDTWMCQRMIRQGSGDSDRGYRSDHEVYLSERDQYGIYSAHSDGYASDWEAFLTKNNYAPTAVTAHQAAMASNLGYRGNAEGQEIEGAAENSYWQNAQYANIPQDKTNQQYQDMGESQQAYWAMDPSLQAYYPPQYDPNQQFQAPENPAGYYTQQQPEVPLQPPDFYQQDMYANSQVYMQRPPGVMASRTLPRRFMGTSPRLKRAQCISVQAPLHGTPQEYHLMPQGHGNVRPVSPGNSPRPGQSTSPHMESMFTYPTMRPMSQPSHMQYHPGPITSQPTNAIQFPPPSVIHPSYYANYIEPPSPQTYPMPPSPRMKHTTQYSEQPMEDQSQQARMYNAMMNPNSGYYNMPRGMQGNAKMHQMNSAMSQEQYRTMETVPNASSPLQYRTNSIPMEMQSLEHECDVNSAASVQHLNRSVPCINIIPSGSPPYTIAPNANPHIWKEEESNRLDYQTNATTDYKTAECSTNENYGANAERPVLSPNSMNIAVDSGDGRHSTSPKQNFKIPVQHSDEPNDSPISPVPSDAKSVPHKQGVYKAMPISNIKVTPQNNNPVVTNVGNDTSHVPNTTVSSESDYVNVEHSQFHDYQNLPPVPSCYGKDKLLLESKTLTERQMATSPKSQDAVINKPNAEMGPSPGSDSQMIANYKIPGPTQQTEQVSPVHEPNLTVREAQQKDGNKSSNHSVMAIAEAINKRETSQPKVSDKVKADNTSKGGYAISSLDDDIPVKKSHKTNNATSNSPAPQGTQEIISAIHDYHQQSLSNATNNTSIFHRPNPATGYNQKPESLVQRKTNDATKPPQQSDNFEQNPSGTSNKRFQKVLPPFDKSHQLKSVDNSENTKNPSNSAMYENTRVNINEMVQNAKSDKSLDTNNSVTHKTVPDVPPKPQQVSDHNTGMHSKSPSTKIASVAQHLINCINKNIQSESEKEKQNENIPDLLTRTGNPEMELSNEKNTEANFNTANMSKVFSNKMEKTDGIISFDHEENRLSGTGVPNLESPDSPKKKNLWFLGTHKNTLVFPVVINKNPSLGFTIEGGVGKPKCPNRPPFDNGIYVAHVASDGPAKEVLRPGDKILQANGVDFSCLHVDKAASFLDCKEPTVSLMVSRE